MKLYVKASSSYRGNLNDFDVKKELKVRYKLDTRRQDTFIHLAVYGAQLLKEQISIDSCDELYITSGIGNIDILQKTDKYVCEDKEYIKPYDFINSLGNTTSYYVAKSLGLKDKNIFQISNNFTFLNTLISVYASLNYSNKSAIVGSVDLCTNPDEVIKRVLGVDESVAVTSSVTYHKFSLFEEGAIGEIEFDTKIYSLAEVREYIDLTALKTVVSMRCLDLDFQKDSEFFETMPSYYIAKALEKRENLLYVDCFEERYRVMKVRSLL